MHASKIVTVALALAAVAWGPGATASAEPAQHSREVVVYDDFYNFENPCVPGDVLYGSGQVRFQVMYTADASGGQHADVFANSRGTAEGSLTGLDYQVSGNSHTTNSWQPDGDYTGTLTLHTVFAAPGPNNNFVLTVVYHNTIVDGEIVVWKVKEEVRCSDDGQ